MLLKFFSKYAEMCQKMCRILFRCINLVKVSGNDVLLVENIVQTQENDDFKVGIFSNLHVAGMHKLAESAPKCAENVPKMSYIDLARKSTRK